MCIRDRPWYKWHYLLTYLLTDRPRPLVYGTMQRWRCRGEIFYSPEFWEKFPAKTTLICRYLDFCIVYNRPSWEACVLVYAGCFQPFLHNTGVWHRVVYTFIKLHNRRSIAVCLKVLSHRIARIPRHRHPREDVGVVECGLYGAAFGDTCCT